MSWPVLIVDDEEDIREGLASVFRARGYRTLTAADGAEALELVRRAAVRPAVVLLDLRMPTMSGEQFLETQAMDPWLAPVPVVVVTAHRAGEMTEHPQVVSVVDKPIDLAHLLQTVREACARR